MSGATGLDYALAFRLMDRMNLNDEQYDEMLDALNAMEMAALDEMCKDRGAK